jgi:hypothetical protein
MPEYDCQYCDETFDAVTEPNEHRDDDHQSRMTVCPNPTRRGATPQRGTLLLPRADGPLCRYSGSRTSSEPP